MPPSRTRYYTTEDIAQQLSVGAATVRRWIRAGKLEAIDIREGSDRRSREWRVSSDALRTFLATRSTVGAPEGEEQPGGGDELAGRNPGDPHKQPAASQLDNTT